MGVYPEGVSMTPPHDATQESESPMIDSMSALPRFVAFTRDVSTVAGDYLPGEFFRVLGRQGSFIKLAGMNDPRQRPIVSGAVLRPVTMFELDEEPFTAISVTDQDAQRKWFASHGVRSIVVLGRLWRDGAGNTYHTAEIIVDGKTVHKTARAYSNEYELSAAEWLVDAGYLVVSTTARMVLWRMCKEAGIALNSNEFHVDSKAAL